MIAIDHSDSRVNVVVLGEFTLADYAEFEEVVNFKVRFSGPVDLYFDLRQMASFTIDVLWEEIQFTREHANDFRHIAVVTESQWVAWSAWLNRVFVSADLRVFDSEQDALIWLDAAA